MRTQVFRDFDAFAESVRDVDSKMLLRNPKRRVWSTASVDLGPINLQFGKLGSGNIAQGDLRHDGYMVYLPLSEAVEYTANGVVMPDQSVAVLEPGCEFCFSTKAEHDWCVAFVPKALFRLGDEAALPDSRSCRVTLPSPRAVDSFRETLLQISGAAAHNTEFDDSPAATRAADSVQRIVSEILLPSEPAEPIQSGRPNISRHKIIRSSLDLLEQQNGKLTTVQDLATAAEVSERTLRTAFNEYFGIGPARYLLLRRQHLIHQALKAADHEEVTVGQVLLAHGEWAFGRFAARYRKLYGELPSETLRRRGV